MIKKILLIIGILSIATPLWAGAPSRPNTYTTGSTISASENTANEEALYNYLQAGVDTFATNSITSSDIGVGAVGTSEIIDGTIINADISSGASIADSKLATITTAGKVSGASLTGLSSIPSGAGVIPSANIPAANIVGEIKLFGGDASGVPSGWLVCDGSAVSRTTYSGLWDVLGTNYGSGDGSTTFNLPDFVSQMVRGVSDNPGTGAGSDTHDHGVGSYTSPTSGATAITEAQMPSHDHTQRRNTGGTSSYNTASSVATSTTTPSVWSPTTGSTGSGDTHNHTGGAITGTSASDSNLPVYAEAIYIIKT